MSGKNHRLEIMLRFPSTESMVNAVSVCDYSNLSLYRLENVNIDWQECFAAYVVTVSGELKALPAPHVLRLMREYIF